MQWQCALRCRQDGLSPMRVVAGSWCNALQHWLQKRLPTTRRRPAACGTCPLPIWLWQCLLRARTTRRRLAPRHTGQWPNATQQWCCCFWTTKPRLRRYRPWQPQQPCCHPPPPMTYADVVLSTMGGSPRATSLAIAPLPWLSPTVNGQLQTARQGALPHRCTG
jgi:hypothetical protein